MAFDGVCVAGIVSELKHCLMDGRISKIYQPEMDELNIVIKLPKTEERGRGTVRLLLSASASLPLVYLTEDNKQNPMTAPNFCMLLRKHIGSGRIVGISQPGFERIIEFRISHLDELGDLREKKLIVEIMGKHSNIIFTDEDNKIIDSIKHIGAQISSVREVLPGRQYEFPPNQEKCSPYDVDEKCFQEVIMKKPTSLAKAIFSSITGFSGVIGQEICFRAGLDGDMATASLSVEEQYRLFDVLKAFIEEIQAEHFAPVIYEENGVPKEFSAVPLSMYQDLQQIQEASISRVLYQYYAKKEAVTRMRQKSYDLRRIVTTAIERTSKKYDLQLKQLKDTDKRDKYRIYGELINTYGYSVEPGAKSFTTINYYDGEEITIPLDATISALENGKKYFAKYNKLKRTYEALSTLIEETKAELDYLLSVQTAMDIAVTEADLKELKQELIAAGYIRGKGGASKKVRSEKSKPFHYVSSDGFHMYVGKNNLQNDELTFKFANAGDMWFHAKQMPGSHVIVKLEGASELPDSTYEEAGRLAAYYSSGKEAPKVEIDYTKRGQLKKPPGAKPGYVIYHTNYSMISVPDITGIREVTT